MSLSERQKYWLVDRLLYLGLICMAAVLVLAFTPYETALTVVGIIGTISCLASIGFLIRVVNRR